MYDGMSRSIKGCKGELDVYGGSECKGVSVCLGGCSGRLEV